MTAIVPPLTSKIRPPRARAVRSSREICAAAVTVTPDSMTHLTGPMHYG